jgi:hypothetical protein
MHQEVLWTTRVAIEATCYIALSCDKVSITWNCCDEISIALNYCDEVSIALSCYIDEPSIANLISVSFGEVH